MKEYIHQNEDAYIPIGRCPGAAVRRRNLENTGVRYTAPRNIPDAVLKTNRRDIPRRSCAKRRYPGAMPMPATTNYRRMHLQIAPALVRSRLEDVHGTISQANAHLGETRGVEDIKKRSEKDMAQFSQTRTRLYEADLRSKTLEYGCRREGGVDLLVSGHSRRPIAVESSRTSFAGDGKAQRSQQTTLMPIQDSRFKIYFRQSCF